MKRLAFLAVAATLLSTPCKAATFTLGTSGTFTITGAIPTSELATLTFSVPPPPAFSQQQGGSLLQTVVRNGPTGEFGSALFNVDIQTSGTQLTPPFPVVCSGCGTSVSSLTITDLARFLFVQTTIRSSPGFGISSFPSLTITLPEGLGIVSGIVPQVPLPATLRLLAAAVGVMGLVSWRTKRKETDRSVIAA
jgi:hypothetical protein